MEMEEIPPEKEIVYEDGDKEATEPAPDVKTQGRKEEAEPDHYSKLLCAPEDVYAEAVFGHSVKKKQAGERLAGNVRWYQAGCLVLALLCLVLLLIVVFLGFKLQSGAAAPVPVVPKSETCSFEQCRADFPNVHEVREPQCRQCQEGWKQCEQTCFYFSDLRLNWDESQKDCATKGGSLAVVTNKSVQQYLTSKGKRLGYWMGLRKSGNQWSWVDNSAVKERFWNAAEQGEANDCGYLNTKQPSASNWLALSCTDVSYYICQLQLRPIG